MIIEKLSNHSNDTCKKFYMSKEWKQCRAIFLKEQKEFKCKICSKPTNIVDHMKPIRYYWHLRLDQNNLQLLCKGHNWNKGSKTLKYKKKIKTELFSDDECIEDIIY